MSKINEMRLGFETAYIDGSVVSSSTYRPQFVSNNHKEGKKVLSSIEDELLSCDGFQISVAFITMSGITPLLQTLKELEKRNIKGEILTTNYLNFSEPRALKKLDELSNITLKMYTFDCIILDEAHHVPAGTYQKIMKHFTPRLWLGMTATPDKRDDNVEGRNVYEIFNYQIAYEIRLQQAMEENLLCPFHYFGITDLSIIDDEASGRDFSMLTGDEKVNGNFQEEK